MGGTRSTPQTFDRHELAIVLSHYDLGAIEQIRVFPRGSSRAPKVRIKSRKGEYLLKRRAPGRDDPFRVAFAQSLQLYLAEHGFPVPGLIGTREGNSMLQLETRIYELFRYRSGVRYDCTPAATEQAGRVLASLSLLRWHWIRVCSILINTSCCSLFRFFPCFSRLC